MHGRDSEGGCEHVRLGVGVSGCEECFWRKKSSVCLSKTVWQTESIQSFNILILFDDVNV